MSLNRLVGEVHRWRLGHGYPSATSLLASAAKVGEEAGEVLGAAVKISEGRATLADLEDEMADVAIALAGFAGMLGIDLEAAVGRRWVHDVALR